MENESGGWERLVKRADALSVEGRRRRGRPRLRWWIACRVIWRDWEGRGGENESRGWGEWRWLVETAVTEEEGKKIRDKEESNNINRNGKHHHSAISLCLCLWRQCFLTHLQKQPRRQQQLPEQKQQKQQQQQQQTRVKGLDCDGPVACDQENITTVELSSDDDDEIIASVRSGPYRSVTYTLCMPLI